MTADTFGRSPLSSEQRAWRWKILCATYFAYAGYYLTRKVFTIAKKSIADDLGWDVGVEAANIWAAYLVAYMIGQFCNSFLGRKLGSRVLLLGGLGTSIAINVIFGFANGYYTFLTFMFVNGLVQASGWPASVGGVSQWLRMEERGTFMGFWSTSYQVGNILVKSLGALLLAKWGWEYAFFGCTLVSVGIWGLVYLWQRNKPEDVGLPPIVPPSDTDGHVVRGSQEDRVSLKEYLDVVLSPIVLMMGMSYFCIKFLRYANDSWLPTFLDELGMEPGPAAAWSQVFDWTGLLGAITAGYLLDRMFKGNWAALSLVCGVGMTLGYVAVIQFGTTPHMAALMFGFVGLGLYGADSILCGAASIEVAGEKNGVAVAGVVNGIGSIGPVIQEKVIGWMVAGRDSAEDTVGTAEEVAAAVNQTIAERAADSASMEAGIMNTFWLALGMAAGFVVMMVIMTSVLHIIRKKRVGEAA
jgi:OPA family sugar phosphate sensor protein UhpC-like MFS transporter